MTKMNKGLILILAVVVILVLGKLSRENNQINQTAPVAKNIPAVQDELQSQNSEGGNVTVTVKPEVLEVGKEPKFKLGLDTHVVDLDFDLSQISKLTDDRGKIYINAIWEGSKPGGHHRNGTLTFKSPLSNTKYVGLTISNIAGIAERKFNWEL